jgi:hypothetical protein
VGGEVEAAAIAAAIHRWNDAHRRALAGRANDRTGWLARRAESLSGWGEKAPAPSEGGTAGRG